MEKDLSWITDIAWNGREMHKIMAVPFEFVSEDGETMAIHLHHLRQVGWWMKGRSAIDLDNPPRLK